MVSEVLNLYVRTNLGGHERLVRVGKESLFPRWYGGRGPVAMRLALSTHIPRAPPKGRGGVNITYEHQGHP